MVFLTVGCKKANDSYQINGEVTIKEPEVEHIILYNYKFDTLQIVPLNDGKFKFLGSIDTPTKAYIGIPNLRRVEFILENREYKFDLSDFDQPTIVGGELNPLVYGYNEKENYRVAYEEFVKVSDSVFSNLDMMDKEKVEKARALVDEKNKVLNMIVNDYQDEILSGDNPTLSKLFILGNNYDWDRYDINKKLRLFDEYEKEIGPHPYLISLRESFQEALKTREKQNSVANGKAFKEVIGHTGDGVEIKLSEVIEKNKYTLLEMWASWCGPCRGEFPHLKEAYEKYKEQGFEIYAISLDEKKDRWLKALEEEKVPWINVVDHDGFKSKVAIDYGVMGIPSSFLISSDGIIIASGYEVREFGLDEKLKELFEPEQ